MATIDHDGFNKDERRKIAILIDRLRYVEAKDRGFHKAETAALYWALEMLGVNPREHVPEAPEVYVRRVSP